MNIKSIVLTLGLVILILSTSSCKKNTGNKSSTTSTVTPNIVLIYADDVGYGDISSYGAQSIATPHIDQLAKKGVRFTNAHSAASTCTPSRYALLTGRYAWRAENTGIARGNAPLLIDTSRTTIADVMKGAGYRTAVIGKWHLGLGPAPEGPNWNEAIKPGPLELGFDYSFIIPATPDRVPTVYVENHYVANYNPYDPIRVSYDQPIGNRPTGKEHPEKAWMRSIRGHNGSIINGIPRIGWMAGGQTAVWDDSLMSDVLTAHAINFIKENKDRSFFLYFASPDIHVPRVPNPQFAGKSGMGPRGDALLELDWQVGQIQQILDSLNIAKNTIIIFTSDNGPVLNDGYADKSVQGAKHPKITPYNKNLLGANETNLPPHDPAGPLRGGKYSIYEGGTRVPFVVYWPGHTKKGMVSDALVSQMDLLASFATLIGQDLPKKAGPDSYAIMPTLLGKTTKGRPQLVEQTNAPSPLALIKNSWKYIEPTPSHPKPQLYNLKKDINESENLASKYLEKVEKMAKTLRKIKNNKLDKAQ